MGKLVDLEMLVMTAGGRQRTEAEHRTLLGRAGLRLTGRSRVVATPTGLHPDRVSHRKEPRTASAGATPEDVVSTGHQARSTDSELRTGGGVGPGAQQAARPSISSRL
ncbi:MAG TPA: hypothetical protein VJT72_22570 [Pseudonocardiaceae bacterium]|nr:hypothetical protein [Pseudonocardiaceae bacterium]